MGLIDLLIRFLSEVNRIGGRCLWLGNSITTFYGVYLDESRFQAVCHMWRLVVLSVAIPIDHQLLLVLLLLLLFVA